MRLILDMLKDATLVPAGAVQIGQNGPYVFVVKPDSTLDLRQVKPGQTHGDLTVINEGVRAGEMVVDQRAAPALAGRESRSRRKKPSPVGQAHRKRTKTIQ